MFQQFVNNQLQAKNRFVRAAINDHLGNENAIVSDAQLELYDRLAKNNIGTIITGHFVVSETGRADLFQSGVFADEQIPRLTKLAQTMKQQGSLAIVQISHSGSNFSADLSQQKVGPSKADQIHQLSEEEIKQIEQQFIEGAGRVKQAGFDGVEVHLAHGYLLSEFLDDTVNLRDDAYGGSDENRFRICKEIIEGIREKCGDEFLIFVKINANNALQDEQYINTFSSYIKYLDMVHVDAIEVSGKGFSKHKPTEEQPYFMKQALTAKSITNIPVILTGGFRTLEMMEQAIDQGIDMIGLGRSLLCQEDLILRLANGEDKVRCIRCNQCFKIYPKQFKRCVFHTEQIDKLKENFNR